MFVIASKQLALDLLTLLKAVLNNSCTGSCEMLLYVPAFTSQALGPFQPSSTTPVQVVNFPLQQWAQIQHFAKTDSNR